MKMGTSTVGRIGRNGVQSMAADDRKNDVVVMLYLTNQLVSRLVDSKNLIVFFQVDKDGVVDISQSVAPEMALSHKGLGLIFLVILIWHSSSLSFTNGGGKRRPPLPGGAKRWVKQLELVVLPLMISERLNAPPVGFRTNALKNLHSVSHLHASLCGSTFLQRPCR